MSKKKLKKALKRGPAPLPPAIKRQPTWKISANAEERRVIKANAKEAGLRVSVYIRQRAMGVV